ncbi:hypothetical protein J2Y66_000427 [Paenarthrobacter nitroguajacolicus]|uniref:hypothetical protein n=1 Tax=Paenarthrobacter nitroguajacolicus TaxID=211146 RepID=UPI00285B4CBB|nr:hypothetical protein [Paenarthrobacter nitroguajacolicus]MDR6985964.1 hypothetical protein [Paenarthrobacter nitroguajacolicus]
MSVHKKKGKKTPWHRRGKTWIITAGAIAAALISIIALWDRIIPPNTEDVADIESLTIIKQTSLAAFAPADLGKDLTLNPAAAAALEPYSVDRAASTGTTKPTPTTVPPTTAPPTTSTATITPTLPTTPVTTSTTQGTSTGSPTMATKITSRPPEEYRSAVKEQKVLEGYVPGALIVLPALLPPVTVNDAGELLPPAQVAAELVKALEEVLVIDGTQGKDPLGWTVAVRLDLAGLAHVPMLLTWSLDGVDISESWKAENLAYRIVATTNHDAGVAEVWIPDLGRPGAYNVNVRLTFESTGTLADLEQLQLPS